jgi:hypothetical protein
MIREILLQFSHSLNKKIAVKTHFFTSKIETKASKNNLTSKLSDKIFIRTFGLDFTMLLKKDITNMIYHQSILVIFCMFL